MSKRRLFALGVALLIMVAASQFLDYIGMPPLLQIPLMGWLGWMIGTEVRDWCKRQK